MAGAVPAPEAAAGVHPEKGPSRPRRRAQGTRGAGPGGDAGPARAPRSSVPRREGSEKPPVVPLPGLHQVAHRARSRGAEAPRAELRFPRSHRSPFFSFPPCTGVTHRTPVASTFLLPAPVTKKKNILSVFRLRGVHVREQQNHHYFVESP